MKLSKLMQKMVVNTIDGDMLGYIVDIDIDMTTYEIHSIIIEPKSSFITRIFPWVFKEKSTRVKMGDIASVGSDVLLIKNEKIK